mmetsp:Transcript_36815/g.97788  ORF Transcript_36815/g.97788 Transcript_36815/m.97788 type:complete len:300 (-) Transcript_36815:112-1011(-)
MAWRLVRQDRSLPALERRRASQLILPLAGLVLAQHQVGLPLLRRRQPARKARLAQTLVVGLGRVLLHRQVDDVVEVAQLGAHQVLERQQLLQVQAPVEDMLALLWHQQLAVAAGRRPSRSLAQQAVSLLLGQLHPRRHFRRQFVPKLAAVHLGDTLHNVRHSDLAHVLALLLREVRVVSEEPLHCRVGLWRRLGLEHAPSTGNLKVVTHARILGVIRGVQPTNENRIHLLQQALLVTVIVGVEDFAFNASTLFQSLGPHVQQHLGYHPLLEHVVLRVPVVAHQPLAPRGHLLPPALDLL